MAPLTSACIAAKFNAITAESSTLGAADPLDDEIAKLKTYLTATLEHVPVRQYQDRVRFKSLGSNKQFPGDRAG